MQHPGVSRAIPMAIIGFMVGALLVIVIRGLQSLDPLWDPGVGIVIGTIFCAGFFMWGLGAFNPKLSQHGEGAEHHAEEAAAEESKPILLLSNSMWQIFTLLVLSLIVLFAFALWGGFTLTTTADPLASTTAIGYFPLQLPFGGPEILVSELLVFVIFFVWMIVSLGAVGALLAWTFGYLNRGLVESQVEASAGAAALTAGSSAGALPSGEEEEALVPAPEASERRLFQSDLFNLLKFALIAIIAYLVLYNPIFGDLFPQTPDVRVGLSLIVALGIAAAIVRPFFIGLYLFAFVVMFYLFYWVLIGMVLPAEPARTLLSLVNGLIVAFLLVRPTQFLQYVGRFAALLARFVRWLPKILIQR